MQKNEKTLQHVFSSVLEIDPEEVRDDLAYQSIPQWDSINHMYLICEIESVFELAIKSDDILEIQSVASAKQVLKKYGVAF